MENSSSLEGFLAKRCGRKVKGRASCGKVAPCGKKGNPNPSIRLFGKGTRGESR